MDRPGSYIALIGADALPYADALAAYCADVLVLPPCRLHDRRIACHPDTLTAQLGDTLVTSAAYAKEVAAVFAALSERTDCRVVLSRQTPGKTYPADIGCNVLVWREFVYGLVPHLWPEVLLETASQGKTLRSVRQGYAGCSALVCGDLVISADPSVLRAVSGDGAETLSITPGGICLPGYDCGFIGGASGFCEDTVVFFGDVERHPNGRKIREALDAQGFRAVSLADAPMCDCGGIRFVRMRA